LQLDAAEPRAAAPEAPATVTARAATTAGRRRRTASLLANGGPLDNLPPHRLRQTRARIPRTGVPAHRLLWPCPGTVPRHGSAGAVRLGRRPLGARPGTVPGHGCAG